MIVPRSRLNLDDALLRLRSCTRVVDRQAAFARVRAADRSAVAARVAAVRPLPPGLVDPLGQAQIVPPTPRPSAKRCVATVISDGREGMVDDLLDTIERFGGSPGLLVVVYCVGQRCFEHFNGRAGVVPVLCHPLARVTQAVKNVVWTLPEIVDAESYVTLEADMLLLGALTPLFHTVESLSPGTILGCRPQWVYETWTDFAKKLAHQQANPPLPAESTLSGLGARREDLAWIFGVDTPLGHLHFNGGLVAGDRLALTRIATAYRNLWPYSQLWIEGGTHLHWGDEFLLNVLLSGLGVVQLAPEWNHQVYPTSEPCADMRDEPYWRLVETEGVRFQVLGRDTRIIYLIGSTNPRLTEPRRLFGETKRLLDTRPLLNFR